MNTNDVTALSRLCAEHFSSAIVAHNEAHPEDVAKWSTLMVQGLATPFVHVEPGKSMRFGFRIVGSPDAVVFATTTLAEKLPQMN